MIRITLAVEHEGNAPDSTIELPVSEARTLLNAGRARLAVDRPGPKTPTQTVVARSGD